MIVVIARIQTDAERRAQVIEGGQALAQASRQEDGCIDYRLCADAEDPNAFLMIEQWETDEALQAHFTTPHIATFMAAVPNLVTAPPDVKFHTVASTRDLSNASVT